MEKDRRKRGCCTSCKTEMSEKLDEEIAEIKEEVNKKHEEVTSGINDINLQIKGLSGQLKGNRELLDDIKGTVFGNNGSGLDKDFVEVSGEVKHLTSEVKRIEGMTKTNTDGLGVVHDWSLTNKTKIVLFATAIPLVVGMGALMVQLFMVLARLPK